MNRVTRQDLMIEYSKNNGKYLDLSEEKDVNDYCIFLEDQLLEKLNQEREVEELFNQTAVFDNAQ
jgi:hypothetical protein